jgi:hypothetical protein
VDVVDQEVLVQSEGTQPGVRCSAVIAGRVTDLLDLSTLLLMTGHGVGDGTPFRDAAPFDHHTLDAPGLDDHQPTDEELEGLLVSANGAAR